MDLSFTDEQRMLRETLRELLAKHSAPEIVRSLEDDPTGYSQDLWKELARMGVLGLTIPEEHGGAGQTMLDVVVLYEELGRALAWTPHFVSGVLAARALRGSEWLPRVASGEAIVTTAWLEPTGGFGESSVNATADGDRIAGTKIMVPFASSADALLTFARSGDGVGLYLVDPRGEGVTMTQEKSLASDAVYEVSFDGAPGERVADWAVWDDACIDGWIALAAYCTGAARRAHEMAVEYAKERVQFDRPIGSFQAIAHPLADTVTEIEGGAVLAHQAAWARDGNGSRAARPLAAMAKLFCADAFKRTTKLGQQVFGGIGFTRDIDMQLYFRRAKQIEIAWWDPRYLEEQVAAAELDAVTAFVGLD